MTLGELFRSSVDLLLRGGNDNPRFEAEQLVMQTCSVGRTDILISPERVLSDEQCARCTELVKRRLSGEPLQYLLGEWEFYGYTFAVGEGVLIPRQDTETLVELAEQYTESGAVVADLCAGSGCIGISLARLTGCKALCYELSEQAYEYLEKNIRLNGVEEQVTAVKADVLAERTVAEAPMLNAVVTNPPYLTAEDMSALQKEVTFEPEMALFGGDDGLEYYRRIIPQWSEKLLRGGLFAAEIGIHQEQAVGEILRSCGIEPQYRNDCCGICRVVYGIKK
ncbi:MAG: peptide chain release factor N(5)-glutamine methyltransferase [Oscillospiraceae bacterium]